LLVNYIAFVYARRIVHPFTDHSRDQLVVTRELQNGLAKSITFVPVYGVLRLLPYLEG
jgi:hypothetical protein